MNKASPTEDMFTIINEETHREITNPERVSQRQNPCVSQHKM